MSPARLELHHAGAHGVRMGPPLLFIHGAFCGAWCWQRHFVPWFVRQGYDCYALSLEGHGLSEGRLWLDALSIDDYVRNLHTTMAALPQAPVVVAHSMGGYVLQQYLERHLLPGAVLLASVAPHGLTASALRLLTQAPELFFSLSRYQADPGRLDADGLRDMRALLFSDRASAEDMLLLAREAQPESTRALLDMSLGNPLWRPSLRGTPALILGGGADRIISAQDVAETAARFGAAPEILPQLGHMLMLDHGWQHVCARIARFLAALPVSGVAARASATA